MKTETDWAPPLDQGILYNTDGFDRKAADSSQGPNSQPGHLRDRRGFTAWNSRKLKKNDRDSACTRSQVRSRFSSWCKMAKLAADMLIKGEGVCTLRWFMRADTPPSLSLPSVQSVSMATWQPAPLQPGWQMQCHPLASRVHLPLLLQKPGQPSGKKKETKASACLRIQAGFNTKNCCPTNIFHFPMILEGLIIQRFSEFLSKKLLKHNLKILAGELQAPDLTPV